MTDTSVGTRNAMADAVGQRASGGKVIGYAGTRPEDADSPANSAKLFECRLGKFGKARAGSVKCSQIEPDPSAKEGVARWFRVVGPDGQVCFDGDISGESGDGDMKLSDTMIHGGAEVTLDSLVYTVPGK